MQILVLLITCRCQPYPSHQHFSSDQCNHLATVLLTVHSLLSVTMHKPEVLSKHRQGHEDPHMRLCIASFHLVLIAGLTSPPPTPITRSSCRSPLCPPLLAVHPYWSSLIVRIFVPKIGMHSTVNLLSSLVNVKIIHMQRRLLKITLVYYQ